MASDKLATAQYNDVIISAMASEITSLTTVYSTVHSATDQRKLQSSESLAFVRGICRWPVNSPARRASNAENVSIWWRHHACNRFNPPGAEALIFRMNEVNMVADDALATRFGLPYWLHSLNGSLISIR